MAEKKDKELSVEERLQALYKLQEYLSKIDSIRTLRGELPHEVKDLEDDVIRFQTRIEKYRDEIAELKEFVNTKKGEIEMRKEKIARYNEQLDNVRNNREYAFLEKEKEFETLEIELAEKQIREARDKQENKTQEIEKTQEDLADSQQLLSEKTDELNEIVRETQKQEEELMAKAKELEPLVEPRTLAAFKRIRKNARNGLGIVTVQRNACGGCFNRIAPQRQLEIKMHKKVIVCEYCGRILVDGAMVGVEEVVPETPVKPVRKGLRSRMEKSE